MSGAAQNEDKCPVTFAILCGRFHSEAGPRSAVFGGHRIAGELYFSGEDIGTGGGHANMNVRAPVAVGDGRHGLEMVFAVGGAGDLTAKTVAGLVVLALGIDVPHFDTGAGDGTASGIEDFAGDAEGLAGHAIFAERVTLRRTGFIERPEADILRRDPQVRSGQLGYGGGKGHSLQNAATRYLIPAHGRRVSLPDGGNNGGA